MSIRIGARYLDKFGRKGGVPQFTIDLYQPDDFVQKVFTFNSGDHFDQPAAAKYLVGTINTVNRLAEEEASSVYLDVTKSGLNLFMNCDDHEVEHALASPVEADSILLQGSKNVGNLFFPLTTAIPFDKLLKLLEANAPRSKHYVEKHGFHKKEGLVRMTLNPKYLNKLTQDVSNFRPPELDTSEGDAVKFRGTLFVELRDTTGGKKHDIALYPFELDVEARLFSKEPADPRGWPEVEGKYRSFQGVMKDCEFVRNEDITDHDLAKKDDDEDFEDEEEPEEVMIDLDSDDPFSKPTKKRKMIKSDVQMLLCGLKGAANQAQLVKQNQEAVGDFIETAFAHYLFLLQGYKRFTYDNSHSFGLSCAGLDIMGPSIQFKDGKMVVEIKIDHEPVHKLENPGFCDDIKGEGWLVHPGYLKESLPPSWWAEVEQRVMRAQGDARYHYLSDPMLKKWLDWGNKSFKHVASPIISMLSNHYYMVDFCKR